MRAPHGQPFDSPGGPLGIRQKLNADDGAVHTGPRIGERLVYRGLQSKPLRLVVFDRRFGEAE